MDPRFSGAHPLPDTLVATRYSGDNDGRGSASSHREGLADQNQTQTRVVGNDGRFQCLICQQTFSRVEHLSRHSRSHGKDRSSLKCRECHKGFYRITCHVKSSEDQCHCSDALRRHEQVHKQPRRSSLGKGARACDACAQARRKCSGERPCFGCQKRSIECTFLRASTGFGMGKTTLDSPTITLFQRRERPPVPMSVATDMGSGHPDHDRTYPASDHDFEPRSASFVPSREIVIDHGTAAILMRAEHASPDPSTVGSNLISETEIDHGSEGVSGSSAWYQNNLSSINWLPDDYLPDFDKEPDSTNLGLFGQTSHIGIPLVNQTSHDSGLTGPPHSVYSSQSSLQSRRLDQTSSPIQSRPEASSPESQNTAGPSGRFYVDGSGARLPHIGGKRRKGTSRVTDSLTPVSTVLGDSRSSFDFAQSDPLFSNASPVALKLISGDTYNEYLSWFNQLCLNSSHFSAFRTTTFPSLQTLSLFVSYYFEFFQPVLPFTHPSTFDIPSADWLLTLSMAAIGSHYVDAEDASAYIAAMHEFLRRVMSTLIETEQSLKFDTVLFTQAQILSCVGMMYCGDERLMEIAKSSHHHLMAFCSNEWTKFTSDPMDVDSNNGDIGHDWRIWYVGETRRRTGYSIWLLDCMWAFHFQMRPQLSLQDARVPVPCQEVLWEATTAREWQQLYSCSSPSPSLHSAIQLVYIEKRLQPSMGEFSRILLIHALFRRTWEVEDYFEQPLTLWRPTAQRQDTNTLHSLLPVWLPGIPTYSKWRNSACDCLDILHWHANSVIGAASGMEHTTVLHLHLARVVLLTPSARIVNLALFMAGVNSLSSEADIVAYRKHIQRWATEDQYKARLAMIHAGVLFWHVRRYSADGFYEPSSVFLATLALWAYGSFAQHTSGAAPQDRESTPLEDTDDGYPTFMQLDRPADDELVQLFVRRGASMQANITGVGNLCSEKGPGRVLLEGRKLLLGLKSWGYSRRALNILTALEQQCR